MREALDLLRGRSLFRGLHLIGEQIRDLDIACERPAVRGRELPFGNLRLHILGQLQQPDRVRDRFLTALDAVRDLLLLVP